MESEADLFGLVGARLAGKYDVEATVARGGFGLVYKGIHRSLKKAIAIKVLIVPEEFNDAARANFMQVFLREAETIAQLRHPAVVQVLDSGADEMPSGTVAPWMVLDWIDGESLDEHLQQRRGRGGRSPEEVFAVLRPVLEALAYAHDLGIAHRDVKPANMMLPVHSPRQSRHGIPGIQLLDFGIAKVMDPTEQAGSGATHTLSGRRAFSPPYAAPEQVGGSRTGPWTDVHAMGLILTEMLTDRPPFTAREQTELFIQVLSPYRPTPGAAGVDVGAWEPVIARSLSLAPRDRYQAAGELLAALDAQLPGVYPRTVPIFAATVPSAPPFRPPEPFSKAGGSVDPTADHSTLGAAEASVRDSAAPRNMKRVAAAVAVLGTVLGVLLFVLANARSPAPSQRPVVHPQPITLLPSVAAPTPASTAVPPVLRPVPVIAPVAAPVPVAAPAVRQAVTSVAVRPQPARLPPSRAPRRSRGHTHEVPMRGALAFPDRSVISPTTPTPSATPGLYGGDL